MNLKYNCESLFFQFIHFILLLFTTIVLGVAKIGGPWTRSMKGVHGPGVHVLYFPILETAAKQSLKIVKQNKKSKRNCQLWFDNECSRARKN